MKMYVRGYALRLHRRQTQISSIDSELNLDWPRATLFHIFSSTDWSNGNRWGPSVKMLGWWSWPAWSYTPIFPDASTATSRL